MNGDKEPDTATGLRPEQDSVESKQYEIPARGNIQIWAGLFPKEANMGQPDKLAEIREFWNKPTFEIHKMFHGAATTVINSARLDIDRLQYELQQTREELTSLQLRNADLAGLNVDLKQRLEQVKAELSETTESFWKQHRENESLRTELADKDKVLEWYAHEENYKGRSESEIIWDRGSNARSILSQYTPKGADTDG